MVLQGVFWAEARNWDEGTWGWQTLPVGELIRGEIVAVLAVLLCESRR